MPKSKVFKSTNSQVVRMPKAVALRDHGKSVEVTNQENGRLALPTGDSWDDFFDDAPLESDFLSDRHQPPPKPR